MDNKQSLASFFRTQVETILSRRGRGLLCLIIFFLSATIALAQTNTGQIKGVVKDHDGAAIPGATVTVTNIASNIQFVRETDPAGEFLFPSLRVGACTLTVSARGFKQLTKTGIELRIGQVIDLELALDIGEISVTETVTTAEQMLLTATGEVSEVIDRKRVAELSETC